MARALKLRDKHLRLDQSKIDRARKILTAASETETIEKSLEWVIAEGEIDRTLRSAKGRVAVERLY